MKKNFLTLESQLTNAFITCYPESFDIKAYLQDHKHEIVSYAYIKHDKDVDSDGQLLKPHYHILIKWLKSKHVKNILNAFGLSLSQFINSDEKPVQAVKDVSLVLQYLIHKNNPEKYQYSKDEIISYGYELDYHLQKHYDSEYSRSLELQKLYEFVASKDCQSLDDLFIFAVNNGYIKTLRGYYPIFKDLFYFRKM